MAHKITRNVVMLAIALLTLPAQAKDEEDTDPKKQPAKQGGIQLRVSGVMNWPRSLYVIEH